MSLATVYKTVESLRAAGLVQQLNVGEESFRYDAQTKPHPHIQCVRCRCVADLEADLFSDIRGKAQRHTRFQVLGEQVYLYGLCPDCQP